MFHSFDIAYVVDWEKHWVTFKFLHDDTMIVTAASYCIGSCSLSTSMQIVCLKSSVFLRGC